MMKNIIKLITVAASCCICGPEAGARVAASPPKDITHYNIMIVPDLSNRLNRNTGLPDVAIVDAIVQQIYPHIARFNRATGQRDRYSLIPSNSRLISLYAADLSRMRIDLSAFKNDQRARIEYLTGRNPGHSLKSDAAAFTTEFSRVETVARQKTSGADIWSFLQAGLDRSLMMYPEPPFTFNRQQYRNAYRNVVVLLTDGYIEAGLSKAQGCDGRQCRYLSGEIIAQFRKAFKSRADKSESLQAFFNRSQYGIFPVNNPHLKQAEVLVLEADDRSLTRAGNPTQIPTDFEIMKIFWEDWMKRSGVRHFEIHPAARNAQEARDVFLSFLGIR